MITIVGAWRTLLNIQYSAHLNIGLLGDRFLNGKSSQNHFANNEYHHSEVVVGSLKGQSCPDVEWFGFQTML
jgi:hypothetical protein